jgi:hypothetical protein
MLAKAAGADVVVVEQLVVSRAEQDAVVDLGRPATLLGEDVVGFEFANGGAARVLAVPGALVERALLSVGGAAPDARVDEVAPGELDHKPARVAAEPLGCLDADRA